MVVQLSVQFPLVLVSPWICHPDEKSFRRLNQGRFSPGCPPPFLQALALSALLKATWGKGGGRQNGAKGACMCACVLGVRAVVGEGKEKIYSCRE